MTEEEADQLRRLFRVTDQTCSQHARLRDMFARRAVALDLIALGLGVYLVSLAFVDPAISRKLTRVPISPIIWIGFIGIVQFFLGIVQLRVDWKARSDAHARSMSLHADLKREVGILIAREPQSVSEAEYARVRAQQAMTANAALPVPDADFLWTKRHHKLKVAVSKHLDDHPGALILLTKLKFILRDNPLW